MNLFLTAENEYGLTDAEIREALTAAMDQAAAAQSIRKILILPPDFTRYHSNAGMITQFLWHLLRERGVQVDVMPALGTHAPVSEAQWKEMFGDIPYEEMLVHDWRHDVVRLGEVPGEYIAELTEGLWTDPVSVEVNRRLLEPSLHG